MCGITGCLNPQQTQNNIDLEATIQAMMDAIQHRGPDDSGAWVNTESGVALGFRRLAILDLSPTGHQPMLSADDRYVIIFNGEIYNFAELRDELLARGRRFRGTSDTEIILGAILEWGVEPTLKRLNGMFAFALWDRRERELHLVRDRLGVKPMYYGWAGKTLVFGSELKALRAHPHFNAEIDRDALAMYMRYCYIPAPYSIYKGISKLPPGTYLTIRAGAAGEPRAYWSAREAVAQGLACPFEGSDEEAIAELEARLLKSVRLRMIADVPLGAFLSGGVDSSTIVALMQAQNNQPVQTFTIGFHEEGFNEAEHAKAIAEHLGTDHTELYVTPAEALAVIPRLPALYDEPFADSSQIPTFLVSQLARRKVTVSLSGDGGDELFGGYNRYFWTLRLWNTIGWIPRSVRGLTAESLTRLSPLTWERAMRWTGYPNAVDKVNKLADFLRTATPATTYLSLVSHWNEPDQIVVAATEPRAGAKDPANWINSSNLADQMMALDLVTYLPDDILAKVDRASMGVSLEARVPYLDDHEVVEFAWRLPLRMKIRNGQGKWILRRVLDRYVPARLIDRPKMGFGVPIDSWLRGPLRDWAEDLLDAARLRREGFFQEAPIRQKWEEHLSGRRNWQYYLWDILMFQAWQAETL